MNLNKFINRIFKAKAAKKDSDFSAFLLAVPLTRRQLLIEKCNKQDVSIYIDDPSEQSAGVYANLRAVASEAELESRLNAKNAITLSIRANDLSKRANVISLLAFIVATIALIKTFL
jgi:tRNA threonylcarbamoyladenosine modification (KEOPS) complex  Pcc1 subunit